jgi:hypothetical protein
MDRRKQPRYAKPMRLGCVMTEETEVVRAVMRRAFDRSNEEVNRALDIVEGILAAIAITAKRPPLPREAATRDVMSAVSDPELTADSRQSEWGWPALVVWCLVLVAIVTAAIFLQVE